MKVTFEKGELIDSVGLFETESEGSIFVFGAVARLENESAMQFARVEVYCSGLEGVRKPDELRDERIKARSKRIQLARELCIESEGEAFQFHISQMADGDTATTEQSSHVLLGELASIRLESVRVWTEHSDFEHNGKF